MLFSEKPEVSPSTGGLVVHLYLQDSQVDLYQSQEGSQLKAGNDPQWSLNLLPLTKDGWVMKVWRYLPGSHLIHQM